MGTPEWGRRERITDPYGRAGSDGAKHFLAEPLEHFIAVLDDAMTTRDLSSEEVRVVWASADLGQPPEFLGGMIVPETEVILPGGKGNKITVSWLALMQRVIGDDYHRSPGSAPNPLGAIRDDAGIIDRIQSLPSGRSFLGLMDMKVGRRTVRIQGSTEDNFIALAMAALANQMFYDFLSEKKPLNAELMLLEKDGSPKKRLLLTRQVSLKELLPQSAVTYEIIPSEAPINAPAVFMICLGSPHRFNG